MAHKPTVFFYPQQGQHGCGIACLRMIGAGTGVEDTLPAASRPGCPNEDLTLRELLELAGEYGLHGTAFASTYEELAQAASLPCLALLNYQHYVVITKIASDGVELADPACGIRQQKASSFMAAWYQPVTSEGIWVQFA